MPGDPEKRPDRRIFGRRGVAKPAFQAFDTRTERWHEAGLSVEVDRAAARKAFREALVILALIAGVLAVFAFRVELFPDQRRLIRYATAVLLVILGWLLAKTAGKGVAPVLFRRMDPATAGTVGFVIRLVTIFAVLFGSLAIAGVDPETLAVGGAFTAVVVGLAAQQTLGNVIAGAVLLSTRPFRVGDRVRFQAGALGGQIEGVVATLGLFYLTLARGSGRIMVPNNMLMSAAVIPMHEPDAVELTARFPSSEVTPAMLQAALEKEITVPIRRPPEIDLMEVDPGGQLSYQVTVSPQAGHRGAELSSEVLAAIRAVGGEGQTNETRAQPGPGDDG